jgi:hypothetical protein
MTRTVVIAAALCLAALTAGNSLSEPAETPILQGAVKQRLVLDETLLKSLAPVTIDVTFETGEGKKSGRYTGVRLWSLIERGGLWTRRGRTLASGTHC